MKLIIDIPDSLYANIRCIVNGSNSCKRLLECVKEGIPLPNHHGRLIDYGYIVDAIDDWINAEEYNYTNATDYLRKRVANTPTIIEASKEGAVG